MKSWKPSGYNSASPYLICKDAEATIRFILHVFEGQLIRRFERPDGSLMHAEVRVNDSVVMIGGGATHHQTTAPHVHVYVAGVEAVYRRAIELGASPVQAPLQKRESTMISERASETRQASLGGLPLKLLFDTRLGQVISKYALPKVFNDTVQRDALHSLLEAGYSDIVAPPLGRSVSDRWTGHRLRLHRSPAMIASERNDGRFGPEAVVLASRNKSFAVQNRRSIQPDEVTRWWVKSETL